MAANQTPTVIEKVHLICTDRGSYKFYDIELLDYGDGTYKCVGYNGAIAGHPSEPQTGTPRPQSATPVSLEEARKHFEKLERSKRKEYRDNPDKPRYVAGSSGQESAGASTAPYTPVIFAAYTAPTETKERTGVCGFLPKPIDIMRARELVTDNNYDASQKLDGIKKYVTHRGKENCFGTNKLGFRVPLAFALERELALLARITDSTAGLTLDGEEMGVYYAYDLLEYAGVDITKVEYSRRQDNLRRIAEMFERARIEEGFTGEPAIRFVRKAETTAEKVALMRLVEEQYLEGVVFANKNDPGQLLKWKQWRSLDCVIVANRGKQSVEGFVYHMGVLQSVGNINISLERYNHVLAIEERGEMAVAEVACLYASGDADARGQLQQGSVRRVRDDKLPEQCTGDQLAWCVTKKVVIDWTQALAA